MLTSIIKTMLTWLGWQEAIQSCLVKTFFTWKIKIINFKNSDFCKLLRLPVSSILKIQIYPFCILILMQNLSNTNLDPPPPLAWKLDNQYCHVTWFFHLQSRSSKPTDSDGTTKIIDETNSTIAAWGAIICAILGCLGNVLTIYVLLRKKSLRKHSTTPFLLSLVGFSKPKPNPKEKANKYPFHKSSSTF